MAQIAFPIYSGNAVVAVIGCFAPVYRFDDTHKQRMLSALGAAAKELSEKLSGSQGKGP